jgi:hypothetical protein
MTGQGKRERALQQPYRVRLPGFVIQHELGLGDVIKHATSLIGISPCGGCGRRAELLNRWVSFAPLRKN